MKADFDIGNLVYVILTVVFLIIGAVGKKKKPRQQVSEEDEPIVDTDNLKAQFQELFREFNPTVEPVKKQDYYFAEKDSVEYSAPIDSIPELSNETIEDIIPPVTQPIDSNINYNDQAQSSLDTTGMDEGSASFDYSKDHSSLVYNDLTEEYSEALSEQEEELSGLIDGFDPKKAFVYSEIFNRKDF